jgi:pantoate--beta-alanine ligase
MDTPERDSLVTLRDIDALRQRVRSWKKAGLSVAVVPTMGALHRGHMVLMERALAMADRVIATIFVNPTQFGPNEDFAAYPRKEAQDFEMLDKAGVHVLFAPTPPTMYPPGFATSVHMSGLSDVLCGPLRPGHFDGVATVVTKLFLQAQRLSQCRRTCPSVCAVRGHLSSSARHCKRRRPRCGDRHCQARHSSRRLSQH